MKRLLLLLIPFFSSLHASENTCVPTPQERALLQTYLRMYERMRDRYIVEEHVVYDEDWYDDEEEEDYWVAHTP